MARRGRPKPKAPMYTPKQQQAYRRCGCDPQYVPLSDDVIEKIEKQKRTGGFNVKPSNICTKHYIARSENGECIECGPE